MDEQTISTDEEIRIREERRLNGLFSLQEKKTIGRERGRERNEDREIWRGQKLKKAVTDREHRDGDIPTEKPTT